MSSVKDRIIEAYLTCFGLGYAPFASGTFGTLGGVALAVSFACLVPGVYTVACLGAATLLTLIGAPLGKWAEQKWQRKDPGQYVLDEVIGFLVTVAFIDPTQHLFSSMLVGFLLFRFFDIFKPPPARQLEKVAGGWGIILDDIVAGVYGAIAMWFYLEYII
ncbi:MAG: phosphatidylglycerophosphatase A [Myxococcota bacterium]|jgi:phosphatidylglycerophosphatase A